MKKLLLFFGFSFIVSFTIAQERTVSGKVTSVEDGSTLPGVNVILKGTTTGTVTDIEGNYKLTVPSEGGTLVFSFIGLATEEVEIGSRSVIDLQMSADVQQLSEVIVTAGGIEREKRGLGYSVATVDADKVQQRSEPDPLRAMQGKMPGVVITGSNGAPGSSSKINIRGMSSLTGNTQPLFIVDGIPFDNSVNASTGASQGTHYSNRAFDIDPNNIESISILKGAAASALYGSRATNGVVVITTKSAKKGVKKGLEITYNGSINFEEISGVPDYQNVYMQGSNQVYNGGFIGNWGAPFANQVDRLNAQYGTSYSKFVVPSHLQQYYPEGTAPHPLVGISRNYDKQGIFPDLLLRDSGGNLVPLTNSDGSLVTNGGEQVYLAVPVDLEPHDNFGGFFNRGRMVENAFTISSGSDKASLNAGVSRMDQEGIVPNQEADRTSMYFGGNGQLDNGLFVSGSVNFVNTNQQTPQTGGSAFTDYYGGGTSSVFSRLVYLPRNFNLNDYPFENPADGSNVFYRALDNPRWISKYNLYNSEVNRAFGNLTLSYDLTDWLNVVAKGGVNTYSENRRSIIRSGGVAVPAGEIFTEDLTNTETNFDFISTINKDLNEDINFRAIVGMNVNQRELSRRKVTGSGIISDGLNGLYRTDATSTQIVDYDFDRLRRLYGVYADLLVSYKDYLFLGLVGRNDWSSTLPQDNNSYFYPGVSLSLVFTDAFNLNTSWLDNGKIRAAATKVGNDADPYLTATNYAITTPFTSNSGGTFNKATLSNRLGNPELKPEFTTEYEFGLEADMFNGRIGLDVTYFTRTSTDQIAQAAVARSTGFSSEVVNFGELQNKGWEIGLDAYPVRMSNGFEWNSYVAFTKIESEVIDAGPDGEIFIGGAGSTFGTIHREGFPYGQIFGTVNAKDDEGNLLIDKSTGLPFNQGSSEIIGDPNPDFVLGWTNSFSFKNITLTALIDWKQGGDIYSFTSASLLLRGQLELSEDREGIRVIPGVYGNPQTNEAELDDSGNKIQNTTAITAFDYHFSDGFGAYGQDEVNIYDATVIRLRELSLGYKLPKSLLEKTPFGSASISVTGRNLWFNAPNLLEGVNLDPEVTTNGADSNQQGFEYGTTPTTRRYGFNISLTF